MRTRLLYLLLFICSYSFAQIPTTGLLGQYELNNGDLSDISANAVNFTKTGTSSTNVLNRFNTANSALQLNGDILTRTNLNFTDAAGESGDKTISYSFWIKTNTNNADKKTIIGDSERPLEPLSGNDTGYYIYLKDGKIGANSRVRYHSNQLDQSQTQTRGLNLLSTTIISDNNWHHVVVSLGQRYINNTASFIRYEITANITIDNQTTQSLGDQVVAAFYFNEGIDRPGNMVVGNNRPEALTTTNKYEDSIDDIYIYKRELTTAEIEAIFSDGNFCATPDVSLLSHSNATSTSTSIAISQSGTYDLAYVPQGQPFNNAQLISGITTGNTSLAGLTPLTTYDVFIREQCSNTTDWSTVAYSFTTPGTVYVNQNATGANTGLNWADAFTSLTDALALASSKSEIWIATGTYTPVAGNRLNTFSIAEDDIKIYGGFEGNETSINQRDFRTNSTIISGDINADDSGVDFTGNNRTENVYHVITISGSRTLIDGVTVTSGQADSASGDERFGAGIRKENTAQGITLKHSIVENNVAIGGGGFFGQFIAGDYLIVENSIFRNNVVTYGGGIYTVVATSTASYAVTLTNSLFHNNTSKDRSASSKGFTGSGAWLRANISGSSLTSIANNCSFVNNSDIGTQASEHGALGLSRVNNGAYHIFTGANNIFYHNSDANGNAALTLNDGHTNFLNSGHVYNSIAQDGFARFNSADQTNTSNVDPLFTDYLNNDFTLQGNSPGKDTGDNSYINLAEDLAGTTRIVDGIVDMGPYERTLNCGEIFNIDLTENLVNSSEATITWSHGFNPNGPFDLVYVPTGQPIGNGTVISGLTTESYTLTTLAPNTFYDIYVRTYCNSTATSYTMTTEGFRTAIFVNHQATGNNDGSSWQNAFTLLQDALAIADDGKEIWVAGGIYKPSTSSRSSYYLIEKENLKIYGGFTGTELQLSQRTLGATETILSGDVLGNDVNTTEFVSNYSNTTRNADNTYRVINITATGDNLLLDGLTISDAHNNISASSVGGAIIKDKSISHLTIRNCTIKDNLSRNDGAGLTSEFELNNTAGTRGLLLIENCKFENNMSRRASGIYSIINSNTNVDIKVENSLFNNNIVADLNNSSATGIAGSSSWFRVISNGSNATLNLTNNTYANNIDLGTGQSLNNNSRSTIAISKGTGITSVFTATVNNSIFWNNTAAGGAIARSITDAFKSPANSVVVSNSIDPLSFNDNSVSSAVNTIILDPLFTDTANGDFTLMSTSPAINAGDNTFVNLTTDLLNNSRISGSIVDMGAYELPVNCGDINDFNVEEISLNSGNAMITWQHPFNNAGPFDLVYVESGQPIANGTLVSNLTTNTYTATGIPSQSSYDYYVRVYCSGVPTAYVMITKTLNSQIFVNHTATGANDGSSWANAYTLLQDGLAAAQNGKTIWIAEGVYHPSVSSRTTYYTIDKEDLKIYGGFAGTETQLSERVLGTNETILSGDLQDNDVNTTAFLSNYTNTTRQDNSYHIINITATGNNLELDRLTFSDVHNNNGTASEGGAILKEKTIGTLSIKNCTIEDNVSRNANTGLLAEFDLNNISGTRGELLIENCKFINNMSRWATGVYSFVRSNTNVDITIANSLFDGNLTDNLNTTTALSISGSAGWFRMVGNTSDVNFNFNNNTLVNNLDKGTGQSLNATSHAVLAISRSSGFNGVLNAQIANNIFWGNKTTGNAATRSITDLYKLPVTSVNIYNSIDESNFNDSSISSTTAISNADPLFTNLSAGDYTLTSGSSAIDNGDNSYALGTFDLAGYNRIVNTTIDMGCYEYGPIVVSPKVYLQGAFMNPNVGETTLMRDDLRSGGLIPVTSTYADGLTCNASVFTPTGANAIVDWVFVELRDAVDNSIVIASQSALLQRDGDVVGNDGVSPLVFEQSSGDYFVVVNHRSHLGVMSASTVALSGSNTTVDLSANSASVLGTTNAVVDMGGVFALISGDFDENSQIQNTDINSVILLLGGSGYSEADIDMNGQIQNSDINTLLYPNLGKGQQF